MPRKTKMIEQTSQQEIIKDFAAGALFANAPMWILTYTLLAYGLRGTPTQTSILLNLGSIGSSIIAAILVTKKTMLEAREISVTLGFFSYIIYTIFLMIIGFRGELIEETSILTGFFIGSALGSKLVENCKRNEGLFYIRDQEKKRTDY